MKIYYKIAGIILFSIFITVFVSPVVASVVPFHLYRIMSRVMLITTFLLFYYYREKLGIPNIRSLGFNLDKKWFLFLVSGFLLGLVSIGLISLIMLNTSIRFIIPDILSVNWFRHLTGYILIGFGVAVIEETFFRGFILQGLLREKGLCISLFITNSLYSIVHFLKPVPGIYFENMDLFTSIKVIPVFFMPLFRDFSEIWPSIIGLFLVGTVLSLAYFYIRQLSLPVGLHAGWIIGIKSLSLGTDVTLNGSLWLSGSVIGNPFTWGVLFIFLLVIYLFKNASNKLDKGLQGTTA